MNEFSTIDDDALDRLVDGELSADERRQLLVALDGQADGWRRCALAFLEAQGWGRALRSVTRESADAVPSARAASTFAAPSSRRFRHGVELLATAALVLVSFGLGRTFNGNATLPGGDDHLASAPATEDGVDGPQRRSPADALTLVVQDTDGKPQRVRVPLIEGGRWGEQLAGAPQWSVPAEFRTQLEQRGLDLATRRRYAPMFFEQQDRLVPMVVPVDDAVITPVSRQVY